MMGVQVPESVPSLLRFGVAVRVLNVHERTVKGWIERGTLSYVQPTGRRGDRLIPSHELAAFADQRGIVLDWDQAM